MGEIKNPDEFLLTKENQKKKILLQNGTGIIVIKIPFPVD